MKISKISIVLLVFIFLLSLLPVGTGIQAETITFTGTELLGRPTDTSISISIVPDEEISLYYEYGISPGTYTAQTSTEIATGGQPYVVLIDGLTPDTRYYYRMQYSTDSGSTWETRPENSFHTQRAPGSPFTFTITSDGHVNILLGNASTWSNTIDDIIADNPDFAIDLGDTVAMRSVSAGDIAGAEEVYEDTLPYFNLISGSAPIFLVAGNHEQEEAWHLLDPLSGSLPVIGTNAEKKYYLNPAPDDFYSGNTDPYPYLTGDQLRQDYYAWTWGDALFVVIDPYWYSTTKPYVSDPGGGETDTTGSGDSWDWTLGETQFNWLKTTLEDSTAKYKFVFSHQMVGGGSISGQADYGHGGANYANLVEWGGYNEDGTTWGWDTERPGWGSLPIHQLMVANGVSAFFHGHDHQYAYEKRDGIVYQAIPAAGFSGDGFNIYTTGDGYTLQALSNSGHLKVTVDPSQTTVDYIRTGETESSYSYNILPASEPVPGTVTLDGGVSSGTANTVSSVSFAHTTGTGDNRLMLVGVSWNCGTTDRSISSVVFNDGTDHPLTEVITQLGYNTSNPRYSAIYSLLNPPAGVTGTVTVTFSGSVSNGIVAGAANFTGVDQATPLGTPVGDGPSDQATTQSVTLTGLNGNELVFDNVFQGASGETQTLTPGAGQTQLWTGFAGNTRASASIEQATGTSVTMSWTASSSSYRTMVAVPINPAPTTKGLLRVQTDPAVPTRIFLDGIQRNDWGLNWVKMPTGSYMLSFSDVYNFNTPETVTVNYYPGTTGNVQSLATPIDIYEDTVTEVIVNFIELGNLRVETDPALPVTIYCDGHPMDDWAFWTNILPGDYTISFEDLDGYITPAPQVATVIAGATTHITGTYVAGVNPVTPAPHGLLRVQTVPAVPTTIFLDGIQRNDWGLNWVKMPAGSYTLSFSDVYGYNVPETVTVNYYPGTTGNVQSLATPIVISEDTVTEVIVNFIELGNLRVETSPATQATIYCDGHPMDDWAFWCNIEPGEYNISFEPIEGKLTPPPLAVTVVAGATTHVIGNYDTGATTLVP